MASEQARSVVPDEEGAVNEALMRLVQEHLFKLLMSEGDQIDLPKVARAVTELGRASVVQKKWQAEVRGKAEAAANWVEKLLRKVALMPPLWTKFVGRFFFGGGQGEPNSGMDLALLYIL
jgi:hypothetical protein